MDIEEGNSDEDKSQTEPTCSFCGKAKKKVKLLIAGPGPFVCNECVSLMADILREEGIEI